MVYVIQNEVKRALIKMGGDKVPELDGYTIEFGHLSGKLSMLLL